MDKVDGFDQTIELFIVFSLIVLVMFEKLKQFCIHIYHKPYASTVESMYLHFFGDMAEIEPIKLCFLFFFSFFFLLMNAHIF